MSVSYKPVMLKSLAEICRAMGVGKNTVKKWAAMGAPIAVETDSRKRLHYRCELMRLYVWLENRKSGDGNDLHGLPQNR